MSTSRCSIRRFAATGVVALAASAGMVGLAPASAQAQETTCQGGRFTAAPPDGATVRPGQVIVYHVDTEVVGGDVLGCSRDVLLSPLVEFVSIRPDGDFWPDASFGPMAGVDYGGPLTPGTYHGLVKVRVRANAPRGADITASSVQQIHHVVGGGCPRSGAVAG